MNSLCLIGRTENGLAELDLESILHCNGRDYYGLLTYIIPADQNRGSSSNECDIMGHY